MVVSAMSGQLAGAVPVTRNQVVPHGAPQVLPILREYGGRYLARGGNVIPLEGKPPARRVVIIEFANLAKARAFWDSPAYRAIVTMRHQAAESRVFIVEGSPTGQ